MKKHILLLLIIPAFCLSVVAQKNKPARCAKVAVETSFISVIDGYPMIFTARITGAGRSKLRYRWTLSNGEIIEGKGTSEINVDTLGYQGEKIKATVTVDGFAKRCRNRASATGFVKPKPYLN
jgi:3',5'-cyclic AMP phosphodiesterase CpdA